MTLAKRRGRKPKNPPDSHLDPLGMATDPFTPPEKARHDAPKGRPEDAPPPVHDLAAYTDWVCRRNAVHMAASDTRLTGAYDAGDPREVAAWLSLYAHMRKTLSADIASWFELRKATREVVTLDEVLEVIDEEGVVWRRGFENLGLRLASKMTGDPERDRKTIDDAVDEVFGRISAARDRATALFASADEADPLGDPAADTPEG